MASTNSGDIQETIRFIGSIGFLLAVMVIGFLELQHAWNSEIKDERLKVFIISATLLAEIVSGHVAYNAVRNRLVVGRELKKTHSFVIHLCNCDRKHCHAYKNKPLPLCARHVGFYGTGFILFLVSLANYEIYLSLMISLPWNIHLLIFSLLICWVAVEGGLGKADIWQAKKNKNIRLIGGIFTAFMWLFLIMAIGKFFNITFNT
ncbi:MAG: DUF2085 domain-containing protein [Nitrososphaerota archaeon]